MYVTRIMSPLIEVYYIHVRHKNNVITYRSLLYTCTSQLIMSPLIEVYYIHVRHKNNVITYRSLLYTCTSQE